jgi:hypothetical protein
MVIDHESEKSLFAERLGIDFDVAGPGCVGKACTGGLL